MVRECGVLGARMQRRVALRGGYGLRILARLVVGVGRHDDGAPRLGRVGVIAVEILELLGCVRVRAVAEQRFREGVHLARRIGIERLGRLVGRRTASQKSARKQAAKAEVRPCTCTGSARDRLECHAPSPRFSFARF